MTAIETDPNTPAGERIPRKAEFSNQGHVAQIFL